MGRKKKEENTMTTHISMGMMNEPYWKETWELCEKLGISPTNPIKEVLRKFMPKQNEVLRKQLEQKAQLDKFKDQIFTQKGETK